MEQHLETFTNTTKPNTFSDDIDSAVSTPYASAPSSPGRTPLHYSDTDGGGGGGFFYSAPASPMHHILSSSSISSTNLETAGGSFEFELTAGPPPSGSMSSADELFLNGQIRPMKLSSHLQHPQDLPPGQNASKNEEISKYRDFKSRDRRRRARSMSPLRSSNTWLESFKDGRDSTEINEIKLKLDLEEDDEKKYLTENGETETETEASSGASSRSSSAGRSSKRWVFLKDFLHRSKSEGTNSSSNKNHKFWSTLSLRKSSDSVKAEEMTVPKVAAKKAVNGVGLNRKLRRSAHEVHYTTNRAQAEEMRRKTYLPYRQGLLGCLGFSSKGYGAMNGFARAFNPTTTTVSSR